MKSAVSYFTFTYQGLVKRLTTETLLINIRSIIIANVKDAYSDIFHSKTENHSEITSILSTGYITHETHLRKIFVKILKIA
jgi:hypothetical protein